MLLLLVLKYVFLQLQGAVWAVIAQDSPGHVPGTLSAAEEQNNFSGCVSGGEDGEQGVGPAPQKEKAKTNKLLAGGITRLCTKRGKPEETCARNAWSLMTDS